MTPAEPYGLRQGVAAVAGNDVWATGNYPSRLASRGFFSGYPCGGEGEPCGPGNLPFFRSNSQATRGRISQIVSNVAGFNDNAAGQQFHDVPAGSIYYTYTYVEYLRVAS